jgi:hypothetical protein
MVELAKARTVSALGGLCASREALMSARQQVVLEAVHGAEIHIRTREMGIPEIGILDPAGITQVIRADQQRIACKSRWALI